MDKKKSSNKKNLSKFKKGGKFIKGKKQKTSQKNKAISDPNLTLTKNKSDIIDDNLADAVILKEAKSFKSTTLLEPLNSN